MADVIYKKGQSANLDNVAIVDGQILVTEDTGEMYIDMSDGTRKKISDKNLSAVGQATLEHGEIFNDYVNNQAYASHVHTEGHKNIGGIKAFSIINVLIEDGKAYGYQLDSVEGLEIGDIYSAHIAFASKENTNTILSEQKDNYGEIENIIYEDNIVGLKECFLPYDPNTHTFVSNTNNTEDGYDNEKNTFRICAKPSIGSRTIGVGGHAEGIENVALSKGAHAEGRGVQAIGSWSHAEGRNTVAHYAAHSEGQDTQALGKCSHVEGSGGQAQGYSSHSEGAGSIAYGTGSHAEGYKTDAIGDYSHSEGSDTIAQADNSHAEGKGSQANGAQAHAEGESCIANTKNSHAEGSWTYAGAIGAHSEGELTRAEGRCAHAEGYGVRAGVSDNAAAMNKTFNEGYYTHAEGNGTTASGHSAHAEGVGTTASNFADHAEGYNTVASGGRSHAEGQGTVASGKYAHAEGWESTATQDCAHAEGSSCDATGINSHAEGQNTVAGHTASHAGGLGTQTGANYQTVIGKYNVGESDTLFEIGNGSSASARFNAFAIDTSNNAIINGSVYVSQGVSVHGAISATTIDAGTIYANGAEVATITKVSDMINQAISNVLEAEY